MIKQLLFLTIFCLTLTPLVADMNDELLDAIENTEISQSMLEDYGYNDQEDLKSDLIDQLNDLLVSR